ncbi:two-component sensor histidine kinase [Actinoplanes bogorensis]|uniref:histidine kinase n=1 Tax=Paractinoplanes bogorensis TaxID=1610840 RepID=A0ABS5YX55_9ACTN|nr:histidine kinase [Actinoplanes bogorensis]MBU2668017.1 two-component sensor histidine kinase [Actinoplanes bogorensis]
MVDRWRSFDVAVRDLPFALLLTALALVPGWHQHGTRLSDLVPERPFDWIGVLAIGLECLPLAVRRRFPALSLVLVSGGFALDQLLGLHTIGGTALAVSLFSAGAHLTAYRKTVVIGATVAYLALAVRLRLPVADLALFYVVLAAMWAVGAGLRQNRRIEAQRRVAEAEAARTAERTRIARELHDVVTHHVTAMVVQTEAARYLATAPDRLDEALVAVTDTGRTAITELRHLLDLLNPGHGGELRALVAQTRRAGQPVELVEEGRSVAAPGGAEVTVYRVAQEALTNALKYDHGARTTVSVSYGERAIDVRISTDGSGTSSGSPGGSGRGLDGLRERIGTLGGDFRAGPQTPAGFEVAARIPVGSAA